MADSYICPTCDHEVMVGEPCVVCASNEKGNWKAKPKSVGKVKKKSLARKPWEQDEVYDGLDLPDDEFDYDGFVESEFGTSDRPWHQRVGIAWYWWLTAVLLCGIWIFAIY